MTNLKELKTQIEAANALGKQKLLEKGVVPLHRPGVTGIKPPTTYDIMESIGFIQTGGSSVQYTNIVYNADNTITLTDKDGTEHIMSCTYEDGKLIGVLYDGKSVELIYDGDVLVKVGKTNVNFSGAPKTPATTVQADSCVAQVLPPIVLDTITAEINNGVVEVNAGKGIDGLTATISGEMTQGSVLSVVSEDFDVSKCNYQWFNGTPSQQTKYSRTPNVDDSGVQNGDYNNSYSKTEVVTIKGATSLTITLKYGTESVSYDYICVFEGNHPDYTASTPGYLKKLGGIDGEETFTVEGDSVTFAFRSDGSGVGSGYGYYAVISGEGLLYEEVSTENTYTIVGNENTMYCKLTGTGDYVGTVETDKITILEE
jgi:hypothetical protein